MEGKNEIVRVSFQIVKPLWEEFNKTIEGVYESASEAIRDLMRNYIRSRQANFFACPSCGTVIPIGRKPTEKEEASK